MAKNKIEDEGRQTLSDFPIAEQKPVEDAVATNAQVSKAINAKDINLEPEPTTVIPFFANDDLTGQVLNARQNADLTPAQLARQEFAAEKAEKQGPISRYDQTRMTGFREKQLFDAMGDKPAAVFRDIAGGIIEAPRQAVAGALDAVNEIADLIEVNPAVAGVFAMALGGGVTGTTAVMKAAKAVSDAETPTIEADPRTVTGSLVRGVSQFLVGFVPALKAVKSAGKAAPYIAGAIADATVFDPMVARLSDLVEEVPALSNPVTEYLASSPDDTEAEGRFKNAIEGVALGGLADGLMSAVKFIRSGNEIRKVSEETGVPVEDVIDETTEASTRPEGRPDPNAPEGQPDQVFIPFAKAAEDASVTIEVPEFKTGAKKAKPERAQNINLSKLNTTEDVQNLLDRVAQADSEGINKARREVITNQELHKLADDLGMTVDDLMKRRQGDPFNAEQILAARKVLVASGENVIQLSKPAANGGDMEVALFKRALAQHRAIQQQVAGLSAEAGRAFQSFNIIAGSSRAQQRAIREALEASGGLEVNQSVARTFAELDDISKIGKLVKKTHKVTTMDMFYEVWINWLLSNPTTHMVNILSNTMVAALTVGERRLARAIGGNIPPGETTAQMKGLVDGARDGFRLAWESLKTGEPIDLLEKVEVERRRSISGESLNISGPAGRFADYLGEAVRVPGRFLTSEDAFFKSVGYRMELHAQAYRQAFNEGLKDEAAARRVLEIVDNPPENIKFAAIDASRYQTFTNKLGKVGSAVEKIRNVVPFARVVAPFVRTPINVMSFTFERTPLAPLMGSVREEIAAGGARRDIALAKITMGSMAMAVSADLALSGSVTGAGPVDRDLKNIMRIPGWQPYSIMVGDTYYSYNRLDPIGALLGLGADMAEIMGQTTEADAQKIAVAAALSVSQNMASKTYMRGLVDFMDAFFSSSTDPEANNYKLHSWLNRTLASVVPAGVASIERSISPEMSATYGLLDRIKSRIPGWSDDLPPRRNIFGEPVVLEGGIGPDIMSPIYISTVKDEPVADELVAQRVSISMPGRVINGVELDAQQYDKYILFYSGQDNKQEGVYLRATDRPLKAKLKELFATYRYKQATDGPEGGKALAIQAVFTAYRVSAKARLIKEYPTLEADVITAAEARLEKLTGR